MIDLSYSDEQILIKVSGDNFAEQIDLLKQLGARYDAKKRFWFIGIGKYNKLLEEFKNYGTSISPNDSKIINNFFNNLKELKVINKRSEIRKFHQELLNCPPLKDFQLTDLIFELNRNRSLTKWATGIGKSWILAALLTHLRYYNEVNKAIILTSSIGIMNLNNELKKFIKNYDESRTLVITSISELKDRLIFDKDYDIIIMTYDSFRYIGDAYDKYINSRVKKVKYRKSPLPLKRWFGKYKGILFLDECHLLGSHNSLRSKFIEMNLQYFEYRYCMSATPVDKEEKFYLILKILDQDLVNGNDYYSWLEDYYELGNKWSRYGINKETFNIEKWAQLQDKLYKEYAVKRDKDLLGLKPAYDVPTININMSKEHREIYEAFTYEVINDIKNRNSQNNAGLVANLANTFQYLQLAVDNPLLLLETPSFNKFNPILQQKIKKFNYEKNFEKLEALDNIIEEECIENDNKIMISYHHPITLKCLEQHLKKDYHVVSAEVPKNERLGIIEDFKKSKNKIILASINVANSSFTLTEAKAQILYERTWAYITYEQFRGRIYRAGQQDEVRYYHLCFNNSIDNLQLKSLNTKGKVVDNLIKKNTLTSEEWRAIFNATQDIDF